MKNRTLGVLMSAVLSTAALTMGQTPPSAMPAPATGVTPAAQAPAPPPSPAAAPMGSPKVEVFPFTAVGEVGTAGWIGRGIQESLQSQVSSTGAVLVMPPAVSGQTPGAPADSIAAAKAAGSNLAVVGTFQINGGQVRANGHLIDVNTGTTIGGFDATGKQDDLFKVEDALGTELARLLPAKPIQNQPMANAAAATANPNPAPATDQVIPQPTVTYLTPVQPSPPAQVTTNYYYPDSFTPAYYGYDDLYGYPYYYGGVGFVGGVYLGGYYGYGGHYGHYGDYGGRGGYGYGGARGGVSVGHGGGGFHGGGGGRR